eukprot:SAG31_NODE_2067_length_6523_cov_8.168120_4_plen_85_part_00
MVDRTRWSSHVPQQESQWRENFKFMLSSAANTVGTIVLAFGQLQSLSKVDNQSPCQVENEEELTGGWMPSLIPTARILHLTHQF